jgi:exopolysaccharide biosynthesis WecB/TagA/CpsF family protein
MSVLRWTAGAVVIGCGVLEALAALYLVVLATAAHRVRRPRRRASAAAATRRLVVLVPAHDEEQLVGRCVESLLSQDYPRELVRVVVIADNCSDATAERAVSAGAEVLVRDQPTLRGKGQALRWALDRLLATSDNFDAVVMVDGDSVADPGLLRGLVGEMEAGAEAVQGEYLVLGEPGARSELRAGAFLLFHVARPAGRAALGMGCALVGNGMLFTRALVQRVPWTSFSSTEDLEQTMVLRLAGVAPRFARGAVVRGPAPTAGRAGRTQRLRWEGGRFNVVRTFLRPLAGTALRTRRWNLLDAAVDLAVPPLGLLVLLGLATSLVAAAPVALGLLPAWSLAPALASLAGVALFVVLGLLAVGAPRSTWVALLSAPLFIAAKVGTYARLSRGLQADRWVRTERGPSAPGGPLRGIEVCGVPVDAVDETGALDVIENAVAAGQRLQVCTVNVQFLVRAARDGRVRRVLHGSGLNLADGAPVLWLARLAGRRLPQRVAGVDLVSRLLAVAAERGMRVFLLGGRGGVTTRLAAGLAARYPALQICGALEPDPASLAADGGAAVSAQVAAAAPDLVLVALGHPKQELWIDANLQRLPAAVAIGVGCTFDILANDRPRAPRWMQTHGLEWLFRILGEPRRLLPRYLMDGAFLAGVLVPRALFSRLR